MADFGFAQKPAPSFLISRTFATNPVGPRNEPKPDPELNSVPTMFALSVLASSALCLTAVVCAGEAPLKSGVIALAICTIAAIHYMGILRLRLGHAVDSLRAEDAVDWLRHSDWLITLPLLQFELFELASRARADTDAGYLGPLSASLLQVPVVLLGCVGRFYAKERVGLKCPCEVAGLLSYAGSTIIWSLTTVNMYIIINSTDTVTGDQDALRVWCLVLISAQFGYPLVAAVQVAANMLQTGDSAVTVLQRLSVTKDYAYAFLDIISKATLVLVLTLIELE